jgi:hypothetical protein
VDSDGLPAPPSNEYTCLLAARVRSVFEYSLLLYSVRAVISVKQMNLPSWKGILALLQCPTWGDLGHSSAVPVAGFGHIVLGLHTHTCTSKFQTPWG